MKKIKNTAAAVAEDKPAAVQAAERIFREVPLAHIVINPLNPRKNFSGPKYDELVSSIRSKGILVPILVRPLHAPGDTCFYEIIAGERRFRASCDIAKSNGGIGLDGKKIPAIIQEMSDDDAYDCMTVENLQRADLTPLEEARAFKLYADKKGAEAIPELAERVGIDPCYIRRRISVLGLPEKVLKAWDDGEVVYGHLEQLVRVVDPEEQDGFFDEIKYQNMSVKELRNSIESETLKLAGALFSKKEIGCLTCPHNTDVQRKLFGEDMANKALCLNEKCYKMNQREWIKANWDKFKSSRDLETNGFAFYGEIPWNERHNIYGSLKSGCIDCEKLISIITPAGKVNDKQICSGPQKCFDELYSPHSKAAKKAAKEESDPDAPRVAWHGEYFREEHFKARLPELVKALPPDDEKILRIQLLAIMEMHPEAAVVFGVEYDPENVVCFEYSASSRYSVDLKAWAVIERLDAATIKSILQELALLILMDTSETSPAMRRSVAVHLGADLSTEWRMNQEYLDKKTTKEIHAIAEKFGIFKDEKARNYLFETLGGKRDRFDLLKKGELVRVILESGVDLAGKVPDEILS